MGIFPRKGRSEWVDVGGEVYLEGESVELPVKDRYLERVEAGRKVGVEGMMSSCRDRNGCGILCVCVCVCV